MKWKIILGILLIAFTSSCRFCTDNASLTIMSYNVQNLFDDISQGNEYFEFDPGNGLWNSSLYHLKLCALADVIKSSDSGNPDILLLQEVENLNAVEDLVGIYLRRRGYEYIHVSCEEQSAIHTVIISRYPLEHIRSHRVWGRDLSDQRFIQEYLIYFKNERFYLFNNHWKSKRGEGSSFKEREAAFSVLTDRMAALLVEDNHTRFVAAGDFNCEVTSSTPFYYNPAETELFSHVIPENGDGSYMYRDDWEMIDNILVSTAVTEDFEIYCRYNNAGFLMGDWGAPLKFSAESGSGYSDHLPLVVSIF